MAITFIGKMAAPCVPCISANMWIFFLLSEAQCKIFLITIFAWVLAHTHGAHHTWVEGLFQVSKGNFRDAYYTRRRIIHKKLRYK